MPGEGRRTEPPAERGVEGEEVHRDAACGPGGEDLAPGRTGATRRGVDARRVEHLPHRRGCDPPEPRPLPLDPPVAPSRILAGQSPDEALERRGGRRPTGAPARAVVPLHGDEPAMPAEQGAHSDREDLAPATPRYQPAEGGGPEPIDRLGADRASRLPAAPRSRGAGRKAQRLSPHPRKTATTAERAASGSPRTTGTRSSGHAPRRRTVTAAPCDDDFSSGTPCRSCAGRGRGAATGGGWSAGRARGAAGGLDPVGVLGAAGRGQFLAAGDEVGRRHGVELVESRLPIVSARPLLGCMILRCHRAGLSLSGTDAFTSRECGGPRRTPRRPARCSGWHPIG